MKISASKMALLAALTLSMTQAVAFRDCLDDKATERCCGKPKPKPRPKSKSRADVVNDYSSCSDDVTKGCPCNKPKPKPTPKGVAADDDSSCDVTKGCACNKPKPKPQAKGVAADDASSCDVTKGCACNKPKPKPQPKGVAADDASSCDVTKGCACNKPKPKPPVVYKDVVIEVVRQFNNATPTEQRSMLAMQAEEYVESASEDMASVLTACAQAYCQNVKNRLVSNLVSELVASSDKEAAQDKLMQALGF